MMKKVFDYMGWKYTYPHKTVYDAIFEKHNLDGNDMVEAINKIVEKELWNDFVHDAINYYWKDETADRSIMPWLFGNPQNFFKLMEEWLNEKAD
jgi:hypothetical protein